MTGLALQNYAQGQDRFRRSVGSDLLDYNRNFERAGHFMDGNNGRRGESVQFPRGVIDQSPDVFAVELAGHDSEAALRSDLARAGWDCSRHSRAAMGYSMCPIFTRLVWRYFAL